jgi:iron complex outermembrane receptor protein
MLHRGIAGLFLAGATTLLLARDGSEMGLLEALSQSDTLATETKLNIDDRPSTITVLHRDQLVRMGFLTLHDALGILPGIESSRSTNGWRAVTMRGAHNPNGFGFDKVKLLIDGVDVTSDLYGTVYYYLDFPVELIERIEVLRGPASVDYGTGAYAGAINVITRLENGDRQLFVQGGDEKYRAIGAVTNHQAGRWRIGLDAYQRSDEATTRWPDPPETSSAWGGTVYQGFKDRSAGVLITDDHFYLKGRTKAAAYDNHTGGTATPVASNDGKNENTHHLLEAGYQSPRTAGLSWQIKTGLRKYTYDMALDAYSIDQVRSLVTNTVRDTIGEENWPAYEETATTIIENNTSRIGHSDFYAHEKSRYLQAAIELHRNRFQVTLGAGYEESESLGSHITTNYLDETIVNTIESVAANPLNPGSWPQTDWSDSTRLVNDGGFIGDAPHRRQIVSGWLRGIAALHDRLDISAGVRLDRYRDLKKTLPGYQMGLLYRATGVDRFKLMAGRAFRAPSRVELYALGARNLIPLGNENLDPETIDTAQIGWLRRLSGHGAMEATLFHSTLRDVIDTNRADDFDDGTSEDTYDNYPKRTAGGLEFGWHQRLSTAHRFQGSLTYLSVRHHGTAPDYAGDAGRMHDIATVLGNIAHTWYITGRWSLNTHAQLHAGRVQNRSDQTIDDNLLVNETLTYQLGTDSRLRLYVHNLFDSTRMMASNRGRHPEGVQMHGRRFYLSFSQRF